MLFLSRPGRVPDGNTRIAVSGVAEGEDTEAQSKGWDHPAGRWGRGERGKETVQHAVQLATVPPVCYQGSKDSALSRGASVNVFHVNNEFL